jgi:hypothetical protein
MTRALAVRLLRLYPRTWRMRYEEEVRALLDDRAPGWRDLAGLVRGASREWIHSLADPIEHPILAFAIDVLAGWMGAVMAISLVANLFAGLLNSVLGQAPDWIATLSSVAVIAASIRGFGPLFNLHQIPIGVHGRTLPLGPLSARQARRWWTILSVAVVLGHWAGDTDLVAVVACPIMFSSGTEKARRRQRAHDELMRLRRQMQAAVHEHVRLRGLLPIHLSTSAELDHISADVARLNREVRAAADAWRHALPIGRAGGERP